MLSTNINAGQQMAKSKNHSNQNEYAWKDDRIVYKDACFECGSYSNIHYHHVVPETLGGTRAIPLCIICHGKVHGRDFLKHRELQRIGIERAKKEGKFNGRQPNTFEDELTFLSKPKNIRIILLLEEGLSYKRITDSIGVSQTTIVKVVKVHKNLEEKDRISLDKFIKDFQSREELIGGKFDIDKWMVEI
jgi:hypothetical protein